MKGIRMEWANTDEIIKQHHLIDPDLKHSGKKKNRLTNKLGEETRVNFRQTSHFQG